jgi:osmoprotectant transport system permease protein
MVGDLVRWFADTPDIAEQVGRHLYLSYVPAVAALVVALPIGLYIGHKRRFEFIVVTLANLGRAIPSFAILSLALIVFLEIGIGIGGDFGFWPTFAALFFLSVPPIVVNTDVGIRSVDPDSVEAARGCGFSEWGVLTRIELPLAAPLIVAGLRTAAVQSVATATLGAFVGSGGLGDFIRLGIRTHHNETLLGGALLVALLAIGTEFGLGLVERIVRPRTRRSGSTPPQVASLQHVAPTRRAGQAAG